MQVGAEGGIGSQLDTALAQLTLKERRKCEYVSCANYKASQNVGDKILVCGGCKSVGVVTVYCTVECQKLHWKDHKLHCTKTVTTTTTTTTTTTSVAEVAVSSEPPSLSEHVAPVFTPNDLKDLLSKMSQDTSPKRVKKAGDDEDDEDEEFDYADFENDSDEDEDDDDDDDEEEDQEVDSFGRALPQNRKKRRPAFGGRQESDDEEEERPKRKEDEEKVDPFLPFGPIAEGTNYWSFGVEQKPPAPASTVGVTVSPVKHAGAKKRVHNKRGAPPAETPAKEHDPTLAALSFSFAPASTTESTQPATTTTEAPVFSFGGTQSESATPTFSVATTAELPATLPTTFEFGK